MPTTSSAAPAARPRQFQFTLATLLAVMAWVGLICLALKQPTEFWAGTIFALTVLALLASVLIAVYRTGRTRAFAVGCLVFGVGYLTCQALVAGSLNGALRSRGTPIRGASVWLFDRLHPPITVQAPRGSGGSMMGSPDAGSGGPGGYGGMSPGGMGEAGGMAGPGGGMPGMPGMGMGGMGGYGGVVSYTTPPPFQRQHFEVICNLALAGLLGVFGGIIAQWLYATRQEQRPAG